MLTTEILRAQNLTVAQRSGGWASMSDPHITKVEVT